MNATILYPEMMYPDDVLERALFGPDTAILRHDAPALAALPDEDCARTDGLMIFRHFLRAADFERFPRLRAVVRMGVGFDRIDLAAAEARGVVVCNVPDYGTTEVADHTIMLTLALRRGLKLHLDGQQSERPLGWAPIDDPLLRRMGVQTLGIVGLGRIGTAVALRAKSFGLSVVFFDPYLPNGTELALGIERAPSLDALLRRSDILSLHAPLTEETRGLIGAEALGLLPRHAVLVNTARGPLVDLAALEHALRSGHLAGAALDVLPVEPPEPAPALLAAWRSRDPALAGRLIVTPHSAYWTREAAADIRRKSAETMFAALRGCAVNVVGGRRADTQVLRQP